MARSKKVVEAEPKRILTEEEASQELGMLFAKNGYEMYLQGCKMFGNTNPVTWEQYMENPYVQPYAGLDESVALNNLFSNMGRV